MYQRIPRSLLLLGAIALPSLIWAIPTPSSPETVPLHHESSTLFVLYPPPNPLSQAAGDTYTVQPGDTAWNIALNHDVTYDELKNANPSVQDYDHIEVGQVLNVPSADNGGQPDAPPRPPKPDDTRVIESLAVTNLDLDEGAPLQDVYSTFEGDGSLQSNWPAKSQWVSFNAMWNHAQPGLGQNCVGGVQGNSEQEGRDLRDSILSVSADFLIDPRFVLAVVLQESNGCVRVVVTTSSNDIHNPGVMQTFNGVGSCNNGVEVSPCPQSEIHQMIWDGVHGGGNNLVTALNLAGFIQGLGPAEEAQAFYRAARMYNSGFFSFTQGSDLAQGGSSECYSSDIGNRLTGWYWAGNSCGLNYSD